MRRILVTLLCVLCSLLKDVTMEGVKIDSNIASITSDCYERIAIGQRLKSTDVLRSIMTQQVKECEKECDLDLDKCSSYDFGIGHQGNGTCNLSPKVPPRSGTLVEDPDYDVYVKRQECRYVELPPPSYPSHTNNNHQHGGGHGGGHGGTDNYLPGGGHGGGDNYLSTDSCLSWKPAIALKFSSWIPNLEPIDEVSLPDYCYINI